MTLVGFKAQNHPQQSVKDHVDDRGTNGEAHGAGGVGPVIRADGPPYTYRIRELRPVTR